MGRPRLNSVGLFAILLLSIIISSCAARSLAPYIVQLPVDSTAKQTERLAVTVEFNVVNYGAVGDGTTNDAQAFQKAWAAACAAAGGYVYVPAGNFQVHPVIFNGPCNPSMAFKVDGKVVAPQDPSIWNNFGRYWLKFNTVSMTLEGQGTIDGQGQQWWAQSCKTDKSKPCVDGPTAIVFDTCKNVLVQNVVIQNGQQMQLAFEDSSGITVRNVIVSAPGDSPNTDGIHLQSSSFVTIQNTQIGTGDDCISIQTGSSNININNVKCGPGHGISVGGLGKSKSRAEVSNVVVDTVVFDGATNGVRIKTWQGSSGYANNLSFQNIKMINTANPIVIDQYYCDSGSSGSCGEFPSNVVISNINYRNISGTSASDTAVLFNCSTTVACTGITLSDINLVQTSGSAATSSCVNAHGTAGGTQAPASCLAS
ncbi:unnamed protein product [Calypogeia fissa]